MFPNEDALETLARQRVRARRGLAIHFIVYVAVNTGLFVLWATTGAHHAWFVWPMLGWGIGLAAHAAAVWLGPFSEIEQRAVARELERLRAATADHRRAASPYGRG
jgi:hypothetical protein